MMRPLAFDSAPLLTMVNKLKQGTYSFLNDTKGGLGAGNSGRIRRIMKELASLSTSLPVEGGAGIFLRVDEDRPDVIKALISGPEDTPYAGGLMEFGIFLSADYPNIPPQVRLVTTGNGSIQINPNLYAHDGAVCLSLLGTWSGPSWNPMQSTLLQVRVSIQSLILVPEPHFNEPGEEEAMHTDQAKIESESYNKDVRNYTMEHTILGMMKSPPPAFKEVVQKHFAIKKDEILAQCREWEHVATDTKPLTQKDLEAVANAKAALEDNRKNGCNRGGGSSFTGWVSSLWSGSNQYPKIDRDALSAESRHEQATKALQESTRLRKEIEAFYASLDMGSWLGEGK